MALLRLSRGAKIGYYGIISRSKQQYEGDENAT